MITPITPITANQIAGGSGQTPVGESAAQYSLLRTLLIWLGATLPMGILAWMVWPLLRERVALHPGLLFWILMIVGMIWQFALALLVLRAELGTLRWSVVAPRIWAQQPRDPRSGDRRPGLWWMLIPIALVFAALTASSELVSPIVESLGFHAPSGTDIRDLADPQFIGQWWILALAVVSSVFNYVLGEELLFRGVLLPRMQGAFGRWDWLANGILFALYHLHKFWAMPLILLTSLPFSWAARRYRTIWFAICLHAIEGIITLILVGAIVSGLAF